MYGTMITLPEPQIVLASSSAWSNAWFTEFVWVAYLVIGLMLVGLLINWLINLFHWRYDHDDLDRQIITYTRKYPDALIPTSEIDWKNRTWNK